MDLCRVCNKEFNNLGVHLRKAHKLSMDDYNKDYPIEEPEAQDEFGDIDTIENVVLTEKKEKEEEMVTDDETELLLDFLNAHELSKKELLSIIENFKSGKNIPAKMIEKRDKKIGELGAVQLKDQNYVETQNLHVAETLMKEHSFKCATVTTKGGTIRKTWCLKKV